MLQGFKEQKAGSNRGKKRGKKGGKKRGKKRGLTGKKGL